MLLLQRDSMAGVICGTSSLFPKVSKTVTLTPKIGCSFAIVRLPLVKSTWNHIGLHNKGLQYWIDKFHKSDIIVSIAGSDSDIQYMCDMLEEIDIAGI